MYLIKYSSFMNSIYNKTVLSFGSHEIYHKNGLILQNKTQLIS